jgi:hypothetical protein
MEFKYKDVREILESTTKTNEQKIDDLFRIDTYMYTNLGKESTDEERLKVTKRSKRIYKAIQKLDPIMGKELND